MTNKKNKNQYLSVGILIGLIIGIIMDRICIGIAFGLLFAIIAEEFLSEDFKK